LLLLSGMILQSCVRTISPGFYTPGFGPRMVQPTPQTGNINALPSDPNFTQSYHKYHKSKANSKFGALVRIIEFEYDISDTLSVIPRITSGFDEVEEVSYESSRPVQQSQQVYNPPTTNVVVSPEGQHSTVHNPGSMSTVYNNMQEKQSQVINRSQLYNSAKYAMEDEDVSLILRTKSLSYIIHLQNADITIFPSKEQIRVLKRMIRKHYK